MSQGTRIGRPHIEHDWSTGVERKRCGTCTDWFPLDHFGQSATLWDGLSNRCKGCANRATAAADANKWRLDNPELARINGARQRAKRRARERELPVGPWIEQDIIDRDGLVCWIKGCEVGGVTSNGRRDWDVDHLIPISKAYPDHPGDTFPNVAIACNKCNREKAARILPAAIGRYKANLRKLAA